MILKIYISWVDRLNHPEMMAMFILIIVKKPNQRTGLNKTNIYRVNLKLAYFAAIRAQFVTASVLTLINPVSGSL